MKKICFILCIITLLFAFNSCVFYNDKLDYYYNDIKEYHADKFMPNLDEIGECYSIKYYCRKDELIFPVYSLKLIAKYDAEAFAKEKERLESAYTYLQEPQKFLDEEDTYTMPVVAFSIAGFDFRVVQFEDTEYPKNFGMVGISETNCQIVYLWQYAPDFDCISQPGEDRLERMLEYINYYFHME